MRTLVLHFADAVSRREFLKRLEAGRATYVSELDNFLVMENASEETAKALRADPLVEFVEEDAPLEPFGPRDIS